MRPDKRWPGCQPPGPGQRGRAPAETPRRAGGDGCSRHRPSPPPGIEKPSADKFQFSLSSEGALLLLLTVGTPFQHPTTSNSSSSDCGHFRRNAAETAGRYGEEFFFFF